MSRIKRERSIVDAKHYRWDDLPKEALKPDLHRRLISTERMMLAHVYLDEGAIVPTHAHENEQLTDIVEGTLRFWLGDEESDGADVRSGAQRRSTCPLRVCEPSSRRGSVQNWRPGRS